MLNASLDTSFWNIAAQVGVVPYLPECPLAQFGTGEAGAIALAQERGWVLLINDYRPLQLAQSLGLHCVGVPDFCVLLYAERRITYRAVRGYLRRLASTTSLALIRVAEQVADEIARERSEL